MSLGEIYFPHAAGLNLLVIALTISSAIALLRLQQHSDPRRRHLRKIMQLLALLSLLAIALRPHLAQEIRAQQRALLITPGITIDVLENVRKRFDDFARVFAIGLPVEFMSILPEALVIPDLAYLPRHFPEVSELHVIGSGLHDYDWQELPHVRVVPELVKPAPGVQFIDWPRQSYWGNEINVTGTFALGDLDSTMLYLADPGGVVDSARIAGESPGFKLRATPRDSGELIYELRATSLGKIHWREKLGVSVLAPSTFRILILQSAPRFETKFLKNWLVQAGHAVAIRTQLTRERFRYEFGNVAKLAIDRLTADNLQQFDVVIIDGRMLTALRPSEIEALRDAVVSGLGILILPDEAVLEKDTALPRTHRNFFLPFQLERLSDLDDREVRIWWSDSSHADTPLVTALPLQIKTDLTSWSILWDHMQQPLAAACQRGGGRVGLSLVTNSQRWVLDGNARVYQRYWSHLLGELARPVADERWLMAPGPVFIHQPLTLRLQTHDPFPVGIITTSEGHQDSVFLRQKIHEESLWLGTFWPRTSGWHRLGNLGGPPLWFYVHSQEEWRALQQARRVSATLTTAIQSREFESADSLQSHRRLRPISLWWFYTTFVMCCTLLWLEQMFQ